VGKLGGVLACLLFAIPFGGVGAWATWAIGTTLMEAHRAQDWVKVRATVDQASLHEAGGSDGGTTYLAEGRYRYSYGGRQYTGTRLGISTVGGSDNIDDWHQEVNARLADAKAAGRPVTVWVNPEDPAQAVFDRELRWREVLFLVPFSLAFGGVGVGALVAMVHVLKGTGGEGGATQAVNRAVGAGATGRGGSARFLWVFAFFWNALSWPIAFLAVPGIVRDGEWVGLLVLLFPLVGLGLLWAAVSASWNAFVSKRRGADEVPRPPARSAPGAFAAQAARAMFDPQQRAVQRGGWGKDRGPEIPPAVVEIEEHGEVLDLRYSGRRHLGWAIAFFATGAILTLIGAAMFASGDSVVGSVAMIAIGTLVDVGAVALLVGRLAVNVKVGELAVEKSGLFGRKSWQVRREAVGAIQPVVSYTVNGLPYYSLFAETGGDRVPLGTSLKGPEMADAVARRIVRALGAPPSIITPAATVPIPITD
jgi:hypothetical protein